MSLKGLQKFADEIRRNPSLSAKFAEAIQRVARDGGYDLTKREAEQFINNTPEPPRNYGGGCG